MNRFVHNILKKIVYYFSLCLPTTCRNAVLDGILNATEIKENVFFSYHLRPKSSNEILRITDTGAENSDVSIIIQGPVISDDDFTLETIKLYLKLFPESPIVFSTWKNQDLAKFEKLTRLIIITETQPSFSGIQNINLQLHSTMAGLRYAKQNFKCSYVLKTRSDQRIYSSAALNLLKSLLLLFPLNCPGIQTNRLISTNLVTLKYRLHAISDMTMFGTIDDMLLYWNVPYDTRSFQLQPASNYTIKQSCEFRLGEMYLCEHFAKKLNEPISTLKSTWDFYSRRFCIIDHSMIDLFWNKYNKKDEFRYNYYNYIHSLQQIKFAEWLCLYTNNWFHYPESFLDAVFSKPIKSNDDDA